VGRGVGSHEVRVVLLIPRVELEQDAALHEPLIGGTAVPALAPEEPLVPAATF
jgi:hypothetical protein